MDNAKIRKILGDRVYFPISNLFKYKNNPWLRNELKRNYIFKNAYKGKRCFILGNGPSLNNLDFKKLKDEYVFTVNMLAKREDYKKLNANFHIWADEKFFSIDERKKEDMDVIKNMKGVNTGDNRPIVFYNYKAHEMIERFQLNNDLDIHYYGCFGIPNVIRPYIRKTVNLTKIIPGFSTVVHYAICIAVYMGFKEIILLGCDCTGFMTIGNIKLGRAELSEYGYKISENEKRRMEKGNHYDSIRNELANYVTLFDVYHELDEYCLKRGVALLNATEGTLLDNVKRVKLDDVLSK